jgi:hypothetical protein
MVGYAVSGSRSAREKAARRGSFLIHSSTSPTKLLRPQELMSSTKNDALEPNSKLNWREYERELVAGT